jgi:apolipoprotein N-acyltransferase
LLLLAAGAVAAFHLANLVPGCALVSVVFLACLVGLTRLGSARRALNWGVVIGLAVYVPYLHFFWRVFVGPTPSTLEKVLTIFGVCVLWMVLPMWLGVFLALATFARRRLNPWVAMLVIPLLWTGVEYFRSELYPLRYSWLGIGYAFSSWPLVLAWTGVYGIGFVLCLVASAAVLTWNNTAAGRVIPWCGVGTLAVLAWAGFSGRPAPADRGVEVVGIQYEFALPGAIRKGLDAALRAHPDAQLFVLSEYAFDGPVPDRVRQWCRDHQRYLIAGGTVPAGAADFYDTVFVIDAHGEVVFQQAKAQPLQFFHDGLPAPQQRVWDSPWGKIGLCICYDLSFTRVTDRLIRQGAQAILCPSMDLESWGAYEHALHTRVALVRAAEYHVPIFRLTSSGISQAVTRDGVVRATAPFPGQGRMLVGRLDLDAPPHRPVDRYPAWLAVAVTGLVAAGAIMVRARKSHT